MKRSSAELSHVPYPSDTDKDGREIFPHCPLLPEDDSSQLQLVTEDEEISEAEKLSRKMLLKNSGKSTKPYTAYSLLGLYQSLRDEGVGPVSAVTATTAGTLAGSYYYGLGSFLTGGSIVAPIPLPLKVMGFGVGLSCIRLGDELRELMAYETAEYLASSDFFAAIDKRAEKIIQDSKSALQNFTKELKANGLSWDGTELKKLQDISSEFKDYLTQLKGNTIDPTEFEAKREQLKKAIQVQNSEITELVNTMGIDKETIPTTGRNFTSHKKPLALLTAGGAEKIAHLTEEASNFHTKWAAHAESLIKREFATQIADLGRNVATLADSDLLKITASSLSSVLQISAWIERLPEFSSMAFPFSITPQIAMINIALSTIISLGADNEGFGEYLSEWFNHISSSIQAAHAANMAAHRQTHQNQLIQLEAIIHYGQVTIWNTGHLADYAKLSLEHDAVIEARLDELKSTSSRHHTLTNQNLNTILDEMSLSAQTDSAVEIHRVLSSLTRLESNLGQYVSLMESLAQLADISVTLPAVTEAGAFTTTADHRAISTPKEAYLQVSRVIKKLASEALIDPEVLRTLFNTEKDFRNPILLIQVIAGMIFAVNKRYPLVNEPDPKLRITEADIEILEAQLPRISVYKKFVFALRDLKLQTALRTRLLEEARKSHAVLMEWVAHFYETENIALILDAEKRQLVERADAVREDFMASEVMIGNYICANANYDFGIFNEYRIQPERHKIELHPIPWFYGFMGIGYGATLSTALYAKLSTEEKTDLAFNTFMRKKILAKKQTLWDAHARRNIATRKILNFDGLSLTTSGMPLSFNLYPVRGKELPILPYATAITSYLPALLQAAIQLGIGKVNFYYNLTGDSENQLTISAHWINDESEFTIAETLIPINRSFYTAAEDIWRIWSGGPHTLDTECFQLLINPSDDGPVRWRPIHFIPKGYTYFVHGGTEPPERSGLYDELQKGALTLSFEENFEGMHKLNLVIHNFMKQKRIKLCQYLIEKIRENPQAFSAWNYYTDLLTVVMSLSQMYIVTNPQSRLHSLLYNPAGFRNAYDLRKRLEAYTGEGSFISEWFAGLEPLLSVLEKASQQILFAYPEDIGDAWVNAIYQQLQNLITERRNAANKPVISNKWRTVGARATSCATRTENLRNDWNNLFITSCIKPGSLVLVCNYEAFARETLQKLIPSDATARDELAGCLRDFDFSQLAGITSGEQFLLSEAGETTPNPCALDPITHKPSDVCPTSGATRAADYFWLIPVLSLWNSIRQTDFRSQIFTPHQIRKTFEAETLSLPSPTLEDEKENNTREKSDSSVSRAFRVEEPSLSGSIALLAVCMKAGSNLISWATAYWRESSGDEASMEEIDSALLQLSKSLPKLKKYAEKLQLKINELYYPSRDLLNELYELKTTFPIDYHGNSISEEEYEAIRDLQHNLYTMKNTAGDLIATILELATEIPNKLSPRRSVKKNVLEYYSNQLEEITSALDELKATLAYEITTDEANTIKALSRFLTKPSFVEFTLPTASSLFVGSSTLFSTRTFVDTDIAITSRQVLSLNM